MNGSAARPGSDSLSVDQSPAKIAELHRRLPTNGA